MIKIYRIQWIFVCMIPSLLVGQLYDSQTIPENATHFFGMGYFPTSWQTNLFLQDAYTSSELKQDIEFGVLSNALRLNYVGTEKMLSQYKMDHPNAKNLIVLILMWPTIILITKSTVMP